MLAMMYRPPTFAMRRQHGRAGKEMDFATMDSVNPI